MNEEYSMSEHELLLMGYESLQAMYTNVVKVLETITQKKLLQCSSCFDIDFADLVLDKVEADKESGIANSFVPVMPSGWKNTDLGLFCPKCPAVNIMEKK